jgi:hypothetical protein
MTTLHEYRKSAPKLTLYSTKSIDRRTSRRHDLETQDLAVERWDSRKGCGDVLGKIVDLSSGGVRIRTTSSGIRPDQQIRVRLELPPYAGICPFVDQTAKTPQPKNEWVGWMAVSRVKRLDDRQSEVAGPLMDMDEMDRGMLGLYLSTQPLAA